jgi:hypothetical protein
MKLWGYQHQGPGEIVAPQGGQGVNCACVGPSGNGHAPVGRLECNRCHGEIVVPSGARRGRPGHTGWLMRVERW